MRVENQGDLEDSYIVTLNFSNPSWDAQVDRYSFLNVSPREIRYFNVTITAPLGPNGNYTDINLTIWSQRSLEHEFSHWREFILWQRLIELDYQGPSIRNLSVEDGSQWDILLSNSGDYPVDVRFTVRLFQGDEEMNGGFQVGMSDWKGHLETGESSEATVTRNIRDATRFNTLTAYTVILVGTDLNEPDEVYDVVLLKWMLNYEFEVSLHVPDEGGEIIPGERKSIFFYLDQTTTDRWGHNWDVFIIGDRGDWAVEINRTLATLVGSQGVGYTLTIQAPPRARPGIRLDLEIRFECVRLPQMDLMSEVHYTVPVHRSFTMLATTSTEEMVPPESLTVTTELHNLGNLPEAFRFEISSLFPKEMSREPFRMRTFNGTLYPFESQVREFLYPFDTTMSAGSYRFRLECHLEEGEQLEQVIEVKVPARRKVSIVGLPMIVVDLNHNQEPVELPFSLRNTGNVDLTLASRLDGVQHWSSPIGFIKEMGKNDSVFLQMDHELDFTLVLYPRDTSTYISDVVTLVLEEVPSSMSWSADIFYNIVGPELIIDEVKVPKRNVGGEPVALDITVVNYGNGPSSTTILLLIEGNGMPPIAEVVVPPIAQWGSTAVTIEFTASLDHDRLYVILDPDNTVKEKENEVNQFGFEILVVESPGWGPSMMAISITAIVVAGISMAMVRRKNECRTST